MMVCPSCGYDSAEPFKFCPECGTPAEAPAAPREQRKVVTILFCDVTGSTALGESTDPEALRALLARYFERMKQIVESHGGTVEKFIGDAVMAVFGVPQVHEDDALRAARAALEMRDALPELGVQARIGVNTGEVVAGTEERLATGDAVNVAARLEQAAQPGQIMIGEETLRLVRDAVETEQVEPLELKGKADPVSAYHLLALTSEPERRHEAPMVGRETELSALRAAFEQAVAERTCQLFTVVGEPGVGKSRLAHELVAGMDATVASGRCPPYGQGVTYWPVIEVVKQLGVRPADPAAETAFAALLAEREASASADDIAWAVRKTLEQAALERPLVCVFDDIHWGETTFLDLVEQMALLSSVAPILLLCTARPELTDLRPAWPVDLGLEPLPAADVEQLLPDSIGGDLRARIARAAGGNPLFVEQMVATAGEASRDVAVPSTLKALLAARIDLLDAEERRVLECAAVEGEVFHRGGVQALAQRNGEVTPRLAGLVRRRLVAPHRARIAGEDGFRFHHLLIRDAAYAALTKARRAVLHERFAGWLEHRGGELVELDELLGYHLEQAARYKQELGDPDAELAERAGRHLAAAGYRAVRRQDYAGAIGLLERAAAVLPPDQFDFVLELELRDALFWLGRSEDALRRADALADRAAAAGDEIAEWCARIFAAVLRSSLEPQGAKERLLGVVEEALPVFEAADDDVALYVAYDAMGWLPGLRWDEALEVTEKAAAHARRFGHEPPGYTSLAAAARFFGATPAPELIAWLDERETSVPRDHFLAAYRAAGLAMLGRLDEARGILAASRAQLAERGPTILLANITAFESVWVELWAGDPAAAVELAAEGWRLYTELGDDTFTPAAAGNYAQALYALGRLDEAEAWADRAAELASEEKGHAALWRQVKAKVAARRGDVADAERLAQEAVEILEDTDYLNHRGEAYCDLAEVLAAAGRTAEAVDTLEQALDCYERKKNLAMVAQVRPRLDALRGHRPAVG